MTTSRGSILGGCNGSTLAFARNSGRFFRRWPTRPAHPSRSCTSATGRTAPRELLQHLAVPKPLVLLLDDFHWADPASTDLLSALLHRPPAAGVLIALAARPTQAPARLATALERAHRAGHLARIELPPLTENETRELVGEHAELFYEETGGNPFYLEQLARAPPR